MGNPDRARIYMLGLATWSELEACVSRVISATAKGDAKAAEAARATAHDLIDHHLDLKIQGVVAMQQDIERKLRDS